MVREGRREGEGNGKGGGGGEAAGRKGWFPLLSFYINSGQN